MLSSGGARPITISADDVSSKHIPIFKVGLGHDPPRNALCDRGRIVGLVRRCAVPKTLSTPFWGHNFEHAEVAALAGSMPG